MRANSPTWKVRNAKFATPLKYCLPSDRNQNLFGFYLISPRYSMFLCINLSGIFLLNTAATSVNVAHPSNSVLAFRPIRASFEADVLLTSPNTMPPVPIVASVPQYLLETQRMNR